MKGISIQSDTEVRIEVDGECWRQGDLIRIQLRSGNDTPVCLFLASGSEKRIKTKSPDAFEILESINSATSPLTQHLTLPVNARITDKTGSFYLLYGLAGYPHLAQLRLQVEPHLHLSDLANLFVTEFRFLLKSVSMGKNGSIDFKLEPPRTKEWASLKNLVLNSQIREKSLETHFIFFRQEMDALQATLKLKLTQKMISRSFELEKCLLSFNQRLNTEVCLELLKSVFEEYKNQFWLPA